MLTYNIPGNCAECLPEMKLPLFYYWKWGSEHLSNLERVLESGSVWLQRPCFVLRQWIWKKKRPMVQKYLHFFIKKKKNCLSDLQTYENLTGLLYKPSYCQLWAISTIHIVRVLLTCTGLSRKKNVWLQSSDKNN